MNIKIITVGKLKEKYLRDGVQEYVKRLGAYAHVELIEVPDEKIPNNPSLAEETLVKSKEGRKILDHVKQNDFMILLDVASREMDSVAFSQYIEKKMIDGYSTIVFVIGGSLGHGEDVLTRADFKLSFSPMTFPHQLMRLILVEQIYRAFKIMKNETYHKSCPYIVWTSFLRKKRTCRTGSCVLFKTVFLIEFFNSTISTRKSLFTSVEWMTV